MPFLELVKAAAQRGVTADELHSDLGVYRIPIIKLGAKRYIDDQSLDLYEARKKSGSAQPCAAGEPYLLRRHRKKGIPKTPDEAESLQDLDGTELLKWIDSHPETSYIVDKDESAITIGELRDEIRSIIETYSTEEKAEYVQDIVLPAATEKIIGYIRARDANSEHDGLHELGLHIDMLVLAMAESGFLGLFGDDFESDKQVAAMMKELYPEGETVPPRTPRKQPQVYRRMPDPVVMRGDENRGKDFYRFIVLEIFGTREPSGTYLPPSEIRYDKLLQALREKPHIRSRYPNDPKEELLADLQPYNIRVLFPGVPEPTGTASDTNETNQKEVQPTREECIGLALLYPTGIEASVLADIWHRSLSRAGGKPQPSNETQVQQVKPIPRNPKPSSASRNVDGSSLWDTVTGKSRRLQVLEEFTIRHFGGIYGPTARELAEYAASRPRVRRMYEKYHLNPLTAIPADLADLRKRARK